MTITRSADAKPGDLAVHHATGDVHRLVERKEGVANHTHPGWWVHEMRQRRPAVPSLGLADDVVDGLDDWTIVTLDQVRAMAAALRAGVPG